MTANFPHGGTTMDDHFDRMRLLIQVLFSYQCLVVRELAGDKACLSAEFVVMFVTGVGSRAVRPFAPERRVLSLLFLLPMVSSRLQTRFVISSRLPAVWHR